LLKHRLVNLSLKSTVDQDMNLRLHVSQGFIIHFNIKTSVWAHHFFDILKITFKYFFNKATNFTCLCLNRQLVFFVNWKKFECFKSMKYMIFWISKKKKNSVQDNSMFIHVALNPSFQRIIRLTNNCYYMILHWMC
jgi:hypothetical protein